MWDIKKKIMSEKTEEIKESIKKHSNNLSKLGRELSQIQFNYKVLDKTKEGYWQKRKEDFEKYHQKGMEYYTEVHALMNIVEKEKAGIFLFSISKLNQLGKKMLELLEEIKQNPSIMTTKDKQQSKWSKELRDNLIKYSDETLKQEKHMNTSFREFYDKYLVDFQK